MFDGGLIDFSVQERALQVPVPHLLAHRRDRNSRLDELAGPTVAQLVNGRLHTSSLTVPLSSVMDHAVVKWERRTAISGIASEDGTSSDMTLLQVAA